MDEVFANPIPSSILPTVVDTTVPTSECKPMAASSTKASQSVQGILYKGAGAIMSSKLVFQGWKLPAVILTDNDDKFLFDLEVPYI